MAKTRSSPLASILWRVVACSAVGVAVTLAIAWWSAWREDWRDADGTAYSARPNEMAELRSAAATRRQANGASTFDVVLKWRRLYAHPHRLVLLPQSRWPDWGLIPSDWHTSLAPIEPAMDDARGWPFRAVWCEITRSPAGTMGVRGGIELPQSASPDLLTYRALPHRPIWPGLAADTAVFALPLFVAWSFVRVARAHRRVTRGCCPRCAYDLRFELRTGCSECGWNRATPQPPAAEAPT